MDKQWTNAVCGQRKKPVNCVFTDSALVEVTGLEPTAPTSRKHRWRCCDLLRFDVSRSSARFAERTPAVFRCSLVRSRAGCEGCGVPGVSWNESRCRVVDDSDLGESLFKLCNDLFKPLGDRSGINDLAALLTLEARNIFDYDKAVSHLCKVSSKALGHIALAEKARHIDTAFLVL